MTILRSYAKPVFDSFQTKNKKTTAKNVAVV